MKAKAGTPFFSSNVHDLIIIFPSIVNNYLQLFGIMN